jgi:triphosphoribosyl-dephospho-CoA synthase
LAIRPDSHIARKHGTALAIAVQHEARAMYRDFRENGPCIGRLMDWDRSLKQRRLNPGTAADLTVATYFAFLSG